MEIRLMLVMMMLLGIVPVSMWVMKEYPYADMNFEQKIAFDGYPLETYETTTPDGYIIAIYRIPYGRKSKTTNNNNPVLLVHGMGGSADMFILLGRYRSVAYNLADNGYDVWLFNARGSRLSRRHKRFDIDRDIIYWNFSFHEIALYDLASTIDVVLKKTRKKPFLIGHSQGNTCFFILLSEKPEYNSKIKMAVAYAPAVRIYVENPVFTAFLYITDLFEGIYRFLGLNELIPYIPNSVDFLKDLAKEQTYFLDLCVHVMSIIGSHKSLLIDRDLMPAIMSGLHPRISIKQAVHFLKNIRADRFAKFDYGPKINKRMYNSSKPPLYDLSKITAPIALFHGPKDDLATKEGVDVLAKQIPNLHFYQQVDYEYFNHLDFLFAKNASELVYMKTIKLFKDFDEGLKDNDV